MYLVYLLPLFLIVVVALAIFAGPALAVILFVGLLLALGAYKFLGRGTDPEHAPRPEATSSEEEETGIWGERRPS
jgi:hypothetical protein